MPKISQRLDVELNEPFYVKQGSWMSSNQLRITEKGLEEYMFGSWHQIMRDEMLNNIIAGKYEIIRLPVLTENEKTFLKNLLASLGDTVTGLFRDEYPDIGLCLVIKFCINKHCNTTMIPLRSEKLKFDGLLNGQEYNLNILD